jgi:alkylation response protein AidB-like acyl-CoA dehydrogenase
MDLNFTEEQSMVRDSVVSYLADNYDIDKRRTIIESSDGWSKDVWRFLAQDLGLLGASFPEEFGGFGGSAIESMILAEEFGRVLTLEPYIETVVIGGGFLKYSGHASATDLIEQIISGELLLAFAQAEKTSRYSLNSVATTATKDGSGWKLNGAKRLVIAAPQANKLIVSARTSGNQLDDKGISLFLVDTDSAGVTLNSYKTYDDRLAANIDFDNVSLGSDALLGEEGEGLALIERVMRDALAATCAEANGVVSQMLSRTLEYTQDRKQFGQSLSSFQVLQHRMVDMFTASEQVTSMAWLANIRISEDDVEQSAYACAAAKAFVSKACKQVGQAAIQLHGGMGITEEMAISHYFKRSTTIEQLYGSADYHYQQIEKLRYPGAA